MLSYQHEYHAGNLADMHKYTLLYALWKLLKSKGKPLTYIDTHTGRGVYDLSSPMANKTGEWQEGFGKRGEEKSEYLEFLRTFGVDRFPGSFAMIEARAGEDDALFGAELHPAEYKILARNFPKHDLRKMDGLRLADKMLPPKTKRGLVFIDPSYEVKSEFENIAESVRRLLRKSPSMTFAVWYPILETNAHKNLEKKLKFNGVEIFSALFPKSSKLRMNGTACAVVSAPFGLASKLESEFAAIAHLYAKLETRRP